MSEQLITGNQLLDLNINWQKLINDRTNAMPNSKTKKRLDSIYYRTLPIMVAIAEAIDDRQINELIELASNQLKLNQVIGGGEELQPETIDRSGR